MTADTTRAADDRRADRARTEPMTVRPLRDGRYVVETDGGVYVVDLDAVDCTCPDHAIRGARCKHLRRVAIEVTGGRVPAPDHRVSACAVCGRRRHVPIRDPGPVLCPQHEHAAGAVVRDREDGSLLVVVADAAGRADERKTDEGVAVAEYPSNARYGDHEPVFEAVYVASLTTAESPRAAKRYLFPASRLVATGRRYRSATGARSDRSVASH